MIVKIERLPGHPVHTRAVNMGWLYSLRGLKMLTFWRRNVHFLLKLCIGGVSNACPETKIQD
jgi:hypothetical protein